MVALFDIAMGFGCSCCNPFAAQLPDIVCHKCRKVLYTTGGTPASADTGSAPAEELDLTPRA